MRETWHGRAVLGIGWRSGAAGVEDLYFNSIKIKIQNVMTIITLTEQHYIILRSKLLNKVLSAVCAVCR